MPASTQSVADQLIAEAARSPQHEAWISRQLLAQRRPSEIMADLRRAIDPERLVREAGGDGPIGLAVACLIVGAAAFILPGMVLPS
jgi:hypothetical protein